jgi:hypothetical protein
MLCDTPINTSNHVQSSNCVVMRATDYDKLRITEIPSVLADGRKSTHIIILKNKIHT